MDPVFQQASQNNCDNLSQTIEKHINGAKVSNLGNQVLLMFDNKSVGTVFPITADTVDIFVKDNSDREWDLKDVSIEKCLDVLRDVAALTTESSERDQTGRKSKSRLSNPFGEDPLGELERKSKPNKNSEGRRASAISHQWEGGSPLALSENSGSVETSQVLEYISDMIPADSAEIDGDKLTVAIDAASIIIIQQPNGNISARSFVDGELVQENENVPAGDLVRWTFEIVNKINERVAKRDSAGGDDVSSDDVWGTMKELARESGQSDDILRNSALFSLKGLGCVARPPFDRTQSPQSFVGSNHVTESFVRGARLHGGAPVRLCENDASKPYCNTLGGKVLVDLGFPHGVQLVNKSDIPKKQKLNFDPQTGQVILTPEDVPTCKIGMWKFWGHSRK